VIRKIIISVRFKLAALLLIAVFMLLSCTQSGKPSAIVEGKRMSDSMETIIVGSLGVNCLIIDCGNGEGVVVDPGAEPGRIIDCLNRKKLKITHVINTHGHFDHVGANKGVVEATGAKLLIHPADQAQLSRAAEVSTMYGLMADNSPMPDQLLEDGMTLNVGATSIRVIHTPGHTPGGCSLYFQDRNLVVTGDTLFADSIGRTDLPGGSHETLLASIRNKLFILPNETVVMPGHGPATTIGTEKRENQWLK
jgi:glyoxylase-like metal-dependent hydrolase (beta-lactamase superfamily II)